MLGFIAFNSACRAKESAEQLIPSEKQKMRILFICYMVIFSALCKADELPNSMKQEVEHLFAYLESSKSAGSQKCEKSAGSVLTLQHFDGTLELTPCFVDVLC